MGYAGFLMGKANAFNHLNLIFNRSA